MVFNIIVIPSIRLFCLFLKTNSGHNQSIIFKSYLNGVIMNEPTPRKRADVFRIFADENRLRIIETLLIEPHCVKELVSALGLEQSLISHHLSVMRQFNLLSFEKRGRETIYRLSSKFHTDRGRKLIDLEFCQIELR